MTRTRGRGADQREKERKMNLFTEDDGNSSYHQRRELIFEGPEIIIMRKVQDTFLYRIKCALTRR